MTESERFLVMVDAQAARVTHLTIKATFGSGTTKYVVSQAFTLTVDSG